MQAQFKSLPYYIPSISAVEKLKRQYPIGTRIRLDRIEENCRPIEVGSIGTVHHIDNYGALFLKWDDPSKKCIFLVIPNADEFTVLESGDTQTQ